MSMGAQPSAAVSAHTLPLWSIGNKGYGSIYQNDEHTGVIVTVYSKDVHAKIVAQANAARELHIVLRRGLECGVFDDAPTFRADVVAAISEAEGRS